MEKDEEDDDNDLMDIVGGGGGAVEELEEGTELFPFQLYRAHRTANGSTHPLLTYKLVDPTAKRKRGDICVDDKNNVVYKRALTLARFFFFFFFPSVSRAHLSFTR